VAKCYIFFLKKKNRRKGNLCVEVIFPQIFETLCFVCIDVKCLLSKNIFKEIIFQKKMIFLKVFVNV
jgi:hypothetical protein